MNGVVVDPDERRGTEPMPPAPCGVVDPATQSVLLARGRIPSLDGLRGVCIIMVSVSHFVKANNSPLPASFISLSSLGGPAVDIFFVISGFLITLLLLREHWRDGRISLVGFYQRRALRILPAYLAFLLVTIALSNAGIAPMDGRAWAVATTYTVNLVRHPSAWIGHVWSLSVEEHFYLLWPLLLYFCGPRGAPAVLIAAIVMSTLARCGMHVWASPHAPDPDLFTITRFDTIAVGCLLAFAVLDPRAQQLIRRINRRPTLSVCASLAFLVLSTTLLAQSGKYDLIVRRPLEAVAIAVVLLVAVSRAETQFGRMLNWRPLAAVGVLSYSLYVWQPLLHPPGEAWTFPWPANVGTVIAAAIISYFCVEKPFLRLKDRLSLECLRPC